MGESGAGKTTLMKKLIDEKYPVPNNKDKSTVGINVESGWPFPYVKDKNINFSANLWDFGGQEIQHMTHQFFMTSRSLYVLLVEDRKQHTDFDYWFNIIKVLGEGSPALVVLNERDCRSITNFDFESFRKFYKDDFLMERKEVDFGADDGRFPLLRQKIQEMLCNLPHIGDELPAQWIPIRQDLEKLRDKKHISFEEYNGICRKNKIDKKEDQLVLSQYLHDLGVILHFQQDVHLADTLFLTPQWVVDAVYAILTSDHVKKDSGRFTRKWMFDLWDKKGYNLTEQSMLLSLMLKDNFDLCFRIEHSKEETYIAPQLLPTIKPEFPWDKDNNLHFRFQYQFMPKGIISRLMVRLNEWIDNEKGNDLVWKKGMVLKKEGVQAQITEEVTKNEGLKVLNIAISGEEFEKKEFLTLIREEIRKIHRNSFSNINVTEMVPIPENPDIAVSYDHLMVLLKKREESFIPQGWNEKVSVRELLEGVISEQREIGGKEGRYVGDINIDFRPIIKFDPVVTAKAISKSKSISTSEVHFQQHISGLKGGFDELKDELTEIEPELKDELESLQKSIFKIEQAGEPEKVKDSGSMNKIKRFIKDAEDAGSQMGKTLKKVKAGYGIMQDIAENYNSIAEWCGMPVVPSAFLKKK